MKISIWEHLLCAFFPDRCLWCGRVIEAGSAFCPRCKDHLPESPPMREYHQEWAKDNSFSVISPLYYEGGVRKTIHAYKFRGAWGTYRTFGRLMAAAVLSLPCSFDAVTWIPLSQKGKRLRGYDQSRLLAKALAKNLNLPLISCLEKQKDTKTQHDLPQKQRWENVRNAYGVTGNVKNMGLLLVDDIVTTGATLLEGAKALYLAGAESVYGCCLSDAALKPKDTTDENERRSAP